MEANKPEKFDIDRAIPTTTDRVSARLSYGEASREEIAYIARLYAACWNSFDQRPLFPYLDEQCVYESQMVLTPMVGKDEYIDFITDKMETIRKSGSAGHVYAELGLCPFFIRGINVQQEWNQENSFPCVLLAQRRRDNLVGVALFEMKAGLIKRIDLCAVLPQPAHIHRLGIYPTLEEMGLGDRECL